ncbi:proline-rich receptor-like protein kinase PERK10 [Andrographis paniculata]|uniref:proline-rich receptor-like protein kinase PERK10 n=1 Tax=Andrographis paniculata TaxID=175694 RepID=UPI0021E9A6DF|nr:proline-rich receptor-like protein kinase PERK10 [Andrographis paniculata]
MAFPTWWSTTWSLIAPPTDQLVGKLIPPSALALGSPRLASAPRRKRPTPAEGGSVAKKKKQKGAPAIDRQTIEEHLASLPVDTSGLPKYLREQLETPSLPLTTAPTISQLTVAQPTDPQPTAAQPTDPQQTAAQPTITLTFPQPTATPTASHPTAAPADILIEPPTTQPAGPSGDSSTAGRPTTTLPTPLSVEDNPSHSSVAPQPTPLAAEGELPMIRWPEEPAGRQTSPPVLSSPVPPPPQEPEVVAAVPDQIAALPDQVAPLPLQPAAQPVDEGPPAAPQPLQPIPPPHDIKEISSSKSGYGADCCPLSVTSRRVGHWPYYRQGTPMAFRIMAPSEATAVFNQAAQEMSVLARINLPTPARPIIARCADLSFADLSPADLESLVQVAIDLLIQHRMESEATLMLDRMMEKITELQDKLPLIRPPSSKATSSQPTADPAGLEVSLKKVNEDLDLAKATLDELQQV